MRLQTKNPVLRGLEGDRTSGYTYAVGETASFSGISTKTGLLLLIIVGVSALLWSYADFTTTYMLPLLIGAAIGGFISVLLANFTKATAFFTLLYAAFEGVLLGTLTFMVEQFYEGIAFNAVLITFVIFGFLLVAYATGIFKVGDKFRKIVYTATFGAFLFYMMRFVLVAIFDIQLFNANSSFFLLLTIGMIVLASFNLLIDFDNSKIAVDEGLPKKYEWRLSLGLLVSLVWLYIEVLRLLMIIASRARD